MSNLALTNYRVDGALMDVQRASGVISNSATGLGTNRDKTAAAEISEVVPLTRLELANIYRKSRIIQNIVNFFPQDATTKWGHVNIPGDGDFDQRSFDDYMRKLDIKELFSSAGSDARHYGDSYLVIGADDGLMWDEELDLNRVRSINWILPMNKWDLTPYTLNSNWEDPEFYSFSMDPQLFPDTEMPRIIHRSRVLRFAGSKLSRTTLEHTAGYNDSVIQSLFSSFAAFFQGVGSSSQMLTDFSVFSYGIEGLAEMMRTATDDQRKDALEGLMLRFLSMQIGMSVSKGIVHDAEKEKVGWINRSFSGVSDVIDRLEKVLISESGYPKSKLMGQGDDGFFSEKGESDRLEYASQVEAYQRKYFQKNIEKLTAIVFAASDGPTRGNTPSGWSWKWESTLILTLKEQAELEKSFAESDKIRLEGNILHPEEVRKSRYSSADYGVEIQVDDDRTKDLEEKWNAPPPINVQPTNQTFNTDSNINFEQFRQDAIDGLVPMAEYHKAMGYKIDPPNDGSGEGYWNRSY